MTEVSYKGDINFNLFAVGRYLVDRWKLSGDANHGAVSKDGIKIEFDIGIQTRKGALFCFI